MLHPFNPIIYNVLFPWISFRTPFPVTCSQNEMSRNSKCGKCFSIARRLSSVIAHAINVRSTSIGCSCTNRTTAASLTSLRPVIENDDNSGKTICPSSSISNALIKSFTRYRSLHTISRCRRWRNALRSRAVSSTLSHLQPDKSRNCNGQCAKGSSVKDDRFSQSRSVSLFRWRQPPRWCADRYVIFAPSKYNSWSWLQCRDRRDILLSVSSSALSTISCSSCGICLINVIHSSSEMGRWTYT